MAAPAMAKPGNNGNPNNSKKIAAAVTVDGVMDHLEALQAIADANDGNRAAGTSGYEASGDYVEATLQAAGYETERQYFTFERETVVAETLMENSPTQRSIDAIVMAYSPNTPVGGVTGDLVAPSGSNLGCAAADWTGVDLSGEIAIISRGACSFGSKAAIAAEEGAAAVIIYNNVAGALNGTLGAPGEAPTAGISQADGQALVTEMANGPVNVTLDLRVRVDAVETFNVLAETAKGRTDNVVMVGAHLDSVEDGPGINDNGSGTAAILETAVQLAKVNKLNNQVRFAWWAAEEHGLLGSTHYVDDLVANDAAELDDIATYLNFDMVASPNYIIGVYDADESTYPAPVAVPDGSIETEQVFTDWFDSIGQPWVDTAFSGRSDYQAFITNGIPASGLFTGADDTKTAEEVALFGGIAGITHDPNYHSPGDDLSNVNAEALDIMSDAIAVATLSLAQDTSTINGERSAGKSGQPHPKGPIVRSEEAAA
ncbi:MAG: M28 family peptidase [Ornithinimicrobium sp.]|nr:M28 family peptidase [Ornithinimicrobium sp.]MDO5740420.1 M28 family peptidase [Ornithinimicrobium sp.]